MKVSEFGNKQKSAAKADAGLPPLRLDQLPERYLSIDPGSVHCGVAVWEVDRVKARQDVDGESLGASTTVRLVEVYERTPDALYIQMRELVQDEIGLVLVEDFQLQKGRNATGSRLPTVKVIGVIEYLCRIQGVLCRIQGTSIKVQVDSWLRMVSEMRGGGMNIDGDGTTASGHYLAPLASNSHKRDAIRHGLYPALRDKRDREVVRLVLTDHNRRR